MQTVCAYCNKIINRTPSDIRKNKYCFCNKGHYAEFCKENGYYIGNGGKKSMHHQRLIKELANRYEKARNKSIRNGDI